MYFFKTKGFKNLMKVKKPYVSLKAGEASFHHGWTIHSSMPNKSYDRRIGFNIQYVATHVKQMKNDTDTAICVRGIDKYIILVLIYLQFSDELNPTNVCKTKRIAGKV